MGTILRTASDNDPANWRYSTSDTATFTAVPAGSLQVGHVVWDAGGTVTADSTPPALSAPTDAANGPTAYTGSVSTDTAGGTLYVAAYTGGTPPTAAQVIAGTGGNIVPASAGSQPVSVSGVQNVSGSGLTASTAYSLAFVHVDNAVTPNTSTVAVGDGFTTAADVVDLIGGEGDFATQGSWVLGSDWSISGGAAHKTGTAIATMDHVLSPTPAQGRTIRVTYTISNYVSGLIRARLDGDTFANGTYRSANGTYQENIIAPASSVQGNIVLQFQPSTNPYSYSIDNVTVVDVTP